MTSSDPPYAIEITTAAGATHPLGVHAGRVLLIVNTASRCGFTPQFAGLEALHRKYTRRGLTVLGFPCNQFGAQEPGSSAEAEDFCRERYAVSFPMHAKLEVNGPGAHPLFRWLTGAAPGVFGTHAVKWNFTKFLVDRRGQFVERFASATPPERLAAAIEALLATPA